VPAKQLVIFLWLVVLSLSDTERLVMKRILTEKEAKPEIEAGYDFIRGQRGDVLLVLVVVLAAMLPTLAYLTANYADISNRAMDYYKSLRTRQKITTIRNLLIDDAVLNGGIMMPPDGESPPGVVIGNAFPAPVMDAWGGGIRYCRYETSPPVLNLTARLISSGRNKVLETGCYDTASAGDDLVENIFVGDIKAVVSMGSTGGGEPLPYIVRVIDARGSESSYAIYGSWVIAWGRNSEGQSGVNLSTYNPNRPEFVTGGVKYDFLTGVTATSAGRYHVLALKSDRTVWAWGYNAYAQLGNGTTTSSLYPVQVPGLSDVTAISAGMYHSLALKLDGTIWAWGSNSSGQLGDGTTTSSLYPVQVPGLSDVTAISAGMYHSLALKSDGTVWAWGENSYGQLGDGTSTNRLAPVQVSGLSDVKAISAGGSHSMALKSDRNIWAWGSSSYGQLGDGTTTSGYTPVQVSGLSDVTAISAGTYHSMALKLDGTAWAWGYNLFGQIGDGTTTNRLTPFLVLSNVSVISAGAEHSLALVPDVVMGRDIIYSWGLNSSGQLGDGTNNSSTTPVKVHLPVMELF
jgi:alpha-tubulin suppressor-like RCC1 family protein